MKKTSSKNIRPKFAAEDALVGLPVKECRGRTGSGVRALCRAFTLIELLVVIAIIAILAAIMLPVLQAAKIRAMTAACIANQSQLARAWVLYTTDNNDFTPGNNWQDERDWTVYTNENWISGWEDPTGSSPNGAANTGDSDSTNTILLTSSTYSTIAQYVGAVPKIYQCPASIVMVQAYPASKLVRTVSMNAWVGYNASGSPLVSSDTNNFKIYNKTTTMSAGLGPSDVFVFIEERGESVDDGFFAIYPPGGSTYDTVQNMPMNNHNGAATIGFADGHVEAHRWLGLPGWTPNSSDPANMNITTPQQPLAASKWASPEGTVNRLNLGDLGWMENHATSHR